MTRTTQKERYNILFRRLNYDGIELLPAYDPKTYPYSDESYRDKWHVPGRKIESTAALVNRATRKGITVSITEHSGLWAETTRLN